MKRDMDTVRDILCKISDAAGKPSWKAIVDGKAEPEAEIILYHIELLVRAGLVTGRPLSMGGFKIWEQLDLSWEGHDFVDSSRDPEIWLETKKEMEKVGSFSFDLIKALAKGFIKKKIEEHTGIDLEL